MMKEENHIFQGLKRDTHQIRQDAKFLWDAHNIRITNREDNSLFSITNEKGTYNTDVTLQKHYVGHCVIGKYLVVFTAEDDGSDNYIYRIEKTSTGYKTVILYHESEATDYSWSPSNPIEAIGDYEGEFIQKIYWVDGVNQPKVINIAKPELDGITPANGANVSSLYNKESFNFVQKLELDEWVTITKLYGGGMFSPGTIQYAFTYYNKYGQESNIFYTTPIYYISPKGRGGNPEERVSNSFKIVVNNLDHNFEYLRIYSIHRTSIDAVPAVKRVIDLSINSINAAQYVDTGTTGDSIDPTKLLYIGGEEIYAGTICHKDGTMFLGDIKIVRPAIFNEDKRAHIKTLLVTSMSLITTNKDIINTGNSNGYYQHYNNLETIPGFKSGETYRLGIQFQHSSGKWSDPMFIKDETIPNSIKPDSTDTTYSRPIFKVTLDEDTISYARSLGYKKVRGLIVPSTTHDRTILAQGMLCPTVFNVGNRVSNTPFSQSSWFLRPNLNLNKLTFGETSPGYISGTTMDNKEKILEGASVEFRHLHSLLSRDNRGAEIQCNNSSPSFQSVNFYAGGSNDLYDDVYMVDQSILTFHSPEIEWGTNIIQTIQNSELKLRIVGLINFTSNVGDISIETSSPPIGKTSAGFIHKSLGSTYNGGKSLVSGLFYRDFLVDETKDGKFQAYDKVKGPFNFLIYPWHKSGSLNNDVNRPSEGGTKTSVLKKKIISNLKFSKNTTWFEESKIWAPANGITPVQVFNSNEMSLIKIPSPTNSGITAINYYGNVDTLVTTQEKYSAAYFSIAPESGNSFIDTKLYSVKSYNDKGLTLGSGDIGDKQNTLIESTDPVRMKYKSTPHAVFALNYSNKYEPWILPSINGLNTELISIVPFWSDVPKDPDDPNSPIILPTIYNIVKYYDKDLSSSEVVDPPKEGDYAVQSKSGASNLPVVEVLMKYVSNEWVVVEDTVTYFKYEPKGIWWKQIEDTNGYNNHRAVRQFESTTRSAEQIVSNDVATPNVYQIRQDNISGVTCNYPFLFLAELYRDSVDNRFGGISDDALQSNMWIPASVATILNIEGPQELRFTHGDTWYSRYDCLKTYPFTQEDENQIVEIGSFMCETRVNIDGRYDRNRGQVSNLNVSPRNFNLYNEIYSQRDNFFNYRILDESFYKQNYFANQITWSIEKIAASDTDPWLNVTLANTLNVNGEKGKVTAIKTWNDILLCFQEKALSQIMFNSRVQIPTADGVPIEIANGYKVDGVRPFSDTIGCNNKWSINNTSMGIYFIDSNTDGIYQFNGQLSNLSDTKGMSWWVKDNHTDKIWNPADYGRSLNGIRTFYDSKNSDIYFTPGPTLSEQPDALCYSEQLGQFTSFMSYGGIQAMFNFDDRFYSLKESGDTIHLYQNNKGDYNNFFGEPKEWSISFISNDNPTYTKIFDTIELRTDHYNTYNTEQLLNTCPVNYMKVSNEYQDSGVKDIDSRNMRKKFRVWRGLLPRNNGTRERIRNPWSMITLGWKPSDKALSEDTTRKAIIHDISVKYTI